MNKITLYVNRKQQKSDGTCAIYVATVVNGQPVRFHTGVNALFEVIDFSKGGVRGSSADAKDKNLIISNCRARVSDIFVRYRLRFSELTPELLRREYDNYTSNYLFYDYAMLKLNERKQDVAPGTYRRHMYQLKKIQRFAQTAHISDINEDFLLRLIRWCKSSCGNEPSGINNTIRVVRFYHLRARKEGLAVGNPFADVHARCTVPNREYLNEKEVSNLVRMYKSNELPYGQQNVLRYFLFSCFTGLRFGDVEQFSKQHIMTNTIVLQMRKTRHETGKIVKIPITKAVRELIGDISNIISTSQPIFRVISNMKTNEFLQEVIKKAGINKHISFHCARHTFATNFLAKNGEKLATLQELLGHAKIEQTRIYAHVIYESVEESMKFFNAMW
jgi:site-specific recombinase XerD